MQPLSNDPRGMRDRYGVVVVGSGYGGSIAAARLASAGHSVCLLERGREWPIGSFPDDLDEVVAQMRNPLNPLGLFDYQAGEDQDILAGNGLGGTSLINANVVIEPNDEVFAHARWPQAIRREHAEGKLKPLMDRVSEMLQATAAGPPGGWPAKVAAMQRSADQIGKPLARLSVAVNFSKYNSKPNHVGVTQKVCTLCGDCVTGCNVGAKNTLYPSVA